MALTVQKSKRDPHYVSIIRKKKLAFHRTIGDRVQLDYNLYRPMGMFWKCIACWSAYIGAVGVVKGCNFSCSTRADNGSQEAMGWWNLCYEYSWPLCVRSWLEFWIRVACNIWQIGVFSSSPSTWYVFGFYSTDNQSGSLSCWGIALISTCSSSPFQTAVLIDLCYKKIRKLKKLYYAIAWPSCSWEILHLIKRKVFCRRVHSLFTCNIREEMTRNLLS